MDDKTEIEKNFFAEMGKLGLLFVLTVMKGAVLMVMWQWFVVPLGVVRISMPWAIGLMVLGGLVDNRKSEEGSSSWLDRFFESAVIYVFVLTVGYLMHLLM